MVKSQLPADVIPAADRVVDCGTEQLLTAAGTAAADYMANTDHDQFNPGNATAHIR